MESKTNHSIESEVNKFTPELIKELKSFFVERWVDNMSTKDLVAYVMDDLDRYYEKMEDVEFLMKHRLLGRPF